MKQLSSGVLMHPSSLFNQYPIGDIGPSAAHFVDFLGTSGLSLWQMLPIGPAGEGNCPYQSMSAFGGNPLLVSPDRLVSEGFLESSDIEHYISSNDGKVNYPAAEELKTRLLRRAFENFENKPQGQSQIDFNAFKHMESYWLDDFSLFLAIQTKEGTSNWTRWSQELKTRQLDAIIAVQKDLGAEIRYHEFVQWQFAVQWNELKVYCKSKGIRLIGDIPMFVAHQSADVWAHPEFFKLDADGNPSVVAGVPPDYFSKTGQLWGLPVYRWDVLAQQKYSWWIERIRIALRRFDLVRLDHFIGFVRTFEVSAQAKTAENGEYVAGGGASFLQALREAFGVLPFIADNLGVVIPEVTALMEQFQIPGTQVLQFEYGSELGTNSILSDEQLVNSVIYTGTHDNDTTEGWYEHLSADQRNNLEKQLGVKNADIVWAMIRKAFGSQANTAIIPMQDFLNLGTEARMNFPGVADGNWQWRLQDGVLNPDLSKKIKNISITNGRLSDGAS